MSREVKIIDFYYQGNVGRMYNLSSNETIVYSALCCLCANGAQEYNCTKLADLIYGVGRMTFQRCCEVLHEKGLIVIQDKKVSVNKPTAQIEQSTAQIEQSTAQIEQFSAQIEQFSEKESTKEKEIIKKNNFLSLNGSKEGEREVLNIKSFIPPTIEDVFAYAKTMNFPEKTARAWFDYWEQTDWHLGKWQPKNWRKNLQIWVQKGAEIYASGMGMPQKTQKPMTQQEKDLEKIATDNAKEKVRKAKSEVFYEDHKPKPVEIDEHHERLMKIVHQSMAHMALNPKK